MSSWPSSSSMCEPILRNPKWAAIRIEGAFSGLMLTTKRLTLCSRLAQPIKAAHASVAKPRPLKGGKIEYLELHAAGREVSEILGAWPVVEAYVPDHGSFPAQDYRPKEPCFQCGVTAHLIQTQSHQPALPQPVVRDFLQADHTRCRRISSQASLQKSWRHGDEGEPIRQYVHVLLL